MILKRKKLAVIFALINLKYNDNIIYKIYIKY